MKLRNKWNNNPLNFRSGRHFMSGNQSGRSINISNVRYKIHGGVKTKTLVLNHQHYLCS